VENIASSTDRRRKRAALPYRAFSQRGDALPFSQVEGLTGSVCRITTLVWPKDTKNRDRRPQVFTISEWDAFLADAREGRFDPSVIIEELRSCGLIRAGQ
jgi:hypothetical protein